jgi:hypothetical protein
VSLACGGLLYVIMFYIYPPAGAILGTLGGLRDRVATLLLGLDTAYNPYAYVLSVWRHPLLLPLLSIFSYLVLLLALLAWFRLPVRLLRQGTQPAQSAPLLLLWLLFPAFVVQLALAIAVDRTGWVGGNLQVRLFPPTMLIAIPLAALELLWLFRETRPARLRSLLIALSVVLVIWFSIAALLKVTNEPLLNNRWLFYTRAEKQASLWAADHLRGSSTWVGLDIRLRAAIDFLFLDGPPEVSFEAAQPELSTTNFFLSEVERERHLLAGIQLPYLAGDLIVYDSGPAKIYHRRPDTFYQR